MLESLNDRPPRKIRDNFSDVSDMQFPSNDAAKTDSPRAQEFEDRRNAFVRRDSPGFERRQFSDSHDSLSADAAELGRAVDQYKLQNRRRYVSYEELLAIVKSLGYTK